MPSFFCLALQAVLLEAALLRAGVLGACLHVVYLCLVSSFPNPKLLPMANVVFHSSPCLVFVYSLPGSVFCLFLSLSSSLFAFRLHTLNRRQEQQNNRQQRQRQKEKGQDSKGQNNVTGPHLWSAVSSLACLGGVLV